MSEMQRRKAGRPPVNATPVTVRIPPDLIEALDDFRRRQDDLPTRPEAVRRILTDRLKA